MKKITLLFTMIVAAAVAFAQQNNWNNTPKTIRDGFSREHPGEANARWDKSKTDWHANYTSNGKNVDEYYDKRGKRTFRRTEWESNRMSSTYNKKIRTRYHATNYRVNKIERPNSPSLFELILNLAGGTKTVYTDERGNEVRYSPRY